MKYKIWNVQYKGNIIKAGQKSLLQLKWPHMTLQVILKCNTADWPLGNPTYTMLPWGWIVLHKINIPHWTRTGGIYSTRYGGLMKLLHVNDQNTSEVQCVLYWSQNGESRPDDLLNPAWACQCGRWVWGRGQASGPCISSSCHSAATGAPCRRSPAAGGGSGQ